MKMIHTLTSAAKIMKKIANNLLLNYIKKSCDLNLLSEMKSLNIGAGVTRLEFATNIDISSKADVSLNLGVDPLPFEDESIDFIYSDHTFEHIENYLFLISEVHRVLKDGGILLLGVPYLTLTKYNLVNPYHLNNFNEFSFDFFDPTRLRGSAAEDGEIDLRTVNYHINYLGIFRFMPLLRAVARRHLFNVARDIQFAIVKGGSPSSVSAKIAKNLYQYYTVISSMRKPY
jgi:SAM-dependent methyltransferase